MMEKVINKKTYDCMKTEEGYADPTAYAAITNIEKEQEAKERFKKLLQTIFNICELSGFHLDERVVVTDKETGKTWR